MQTRGSDTPAREEDALFREMRRVKQKLTFEECREILQKQPRGVLAVNGENGYPYAFPMNFICVDGRLYFHCAREGHKTDAIEADSRVSFCVTDEGYREEGEWPLNIKSVVIFGRMTRINDEKKHREILSALGMKYYPSEKDVQSVLQSAADRALIFELEVDHLTGKLVKES